MIRSRTIFTLLLFALMLSRTALADTIALPLSIDSQLLRSLVIKAAYTGEERTAVLAGHRGGCKAIVLSNPQYVIRDGRIHFETKAFIKAGLSLGNTCILPFSWEGYVSLTQVPVIDERWVLSFKTIASAVYDKNHEPAGVIGFFWNLIKTHVFEYIDHIAIDLAPPVEELRLFTRDLFPPASQGKAERIIDSFRVGRVQAEPEKITVEIIAEVDGGAVEKEGDQEPLDQREPKEFISLLETWDGYLVSTLTSLPRERLSDDERELILDVLLGARHRFEDELLSPYGGGDFVRREFIEAWGRLSSIFKNRMSDDPGRPLLAYLAFFTASDALVVLDKVGPGLGIQISRNGLIHLARLISSREVTDLSYEFIVNEDLRSLLGLGPPIPSTIPSFEGESIELDPEDEEWRPEPMGPSVWVRNLFMGTAWAKTSPKQPFRDRISPWLVPKGDVQPYLKRVRSLLNDASNQIFPKTALQNELNEFYTLLVLSTAWQETCFRQFTIEAGKATYLRSYNQTSVGIMQVNERVWRGIYDVNQLRWDIFYNAAAGCEILGIYLHRYALPEMKRLGSKEGFDQEILAKIAYAVYCGGPSQLQHSVKRLTDRRPNQIDKLFMEKYQWVCGNQWEKIEICL